MTRRGFVLAPAIAAAAQAQPRDGGWRALMNGKDLTGWEVRGDCAWTVLPGGILVGQRTHADPGNPFGNDWPVDKKRFQGWVYRQAWLYSKEEFTNFDLHVEYWLPKGVNSGISIRDRSRAHSAIGETDAQRPNLASFPKTTPAHIGYEIQLIDDDKEKYPTGSIYSLVAAKRGVQRSGEWNTIEIESRPQLIRVRVNGQVVAEGPGDPARSKTGPIGFQLHDQFTFAMFRDIRIREVNK